MNRSSVYILGGCIFFLLISVVPCNHAQDVPGDATTQDITGEVVAVDTAAKTITIKSLVDEVSGRYESSTFSVAPTVAISEGNIVGILSDLKPGEFVKVNCVVNSDGTKAIDSITIAEDESE